jgi:hypothetical protein
MVSTYNVISVVFELYQRNVRHTNHYRSKSSQCKFIRTTNPSRCLHQTYTHSKNTAESFHHNTNIKYDKPKISNWFCYRDFVGLAWKKSHCLQLVHHNAKNVVFVWGGGLTLVHNCETSLKGSFSLGVAVVMELVYFL